MVGNNIDAFCARCGLTLAHIILYEVGGAVQGVKCKTCGAQHRYHGPKPGRQRDIAGERRSAKETARAPRPVRPADARLWEQRIAAALPDAVVWDYRLTERYEKGDTISHPQFGRGFVEKITSDSMEVIFREGRKALAMNRQPAPEETGG